MSALSLTGDWLAVAGASLLTFGTGAQASAEIREYRDLFSDLPEATRQAIIDKVTTPLRATITSPNKIRRLLTAAASGSSKTLSPWLLLRTAFAITFDIPGQLAKIRTGEHGDAAERAAKLIRLAAVWSVLFTGSELLLAVAIIQIIGALTTKGTP